MKKLFLYSLATINGASALLKTCSPSFHDNFLSGGDEISMRWEYCTKMTFSKSGFAEWHSWSTYRKKETFNLMFQNYVNEHKDREHSLQDEILDPNKHMLSIDLAIYDELQWQKMMHEVSMMKEIKHLNGTEQTVYQGRFGEPMTCRERLAHAIQIDTITIYPNSTMVVEDVKKRNITESHGDRVGVKHLYNKYALEFASKEEHAHFDDREWHDKMLEEQDQTWYFVLADCEGALELFRDEESQKDHLLGLSVLWHTEEKNADPVGYYQTYGKASPREILGDGFSSGKTENADSEETEDDDSEDALGATGFDFEEYSEEH
jgi:hypothetical protein